MTSPAKPSDPIGIPAREKAGDRGSHRGSSHGSHGGGSLGHGGSLGRGSSFGSRSLHAESPVIVGSPEPLVIVGSPERRPSARRPSGPPDVARDGEEVHVPLEHAAAMFRAACFAGGVSREVALAAYLAEVDAGAASRLSALIQAVFESLAAEQVHQLAAIVRRKSPGK